MFDINITYGRKVEIRMKMNYTYGLKRGLPIALGYLSVAFSFGISAVSDGLSPVQAVLISLTNFTSAGQKAGVPIMIAMGTIIEMIMTQFIINLRYSLMGIALAQHLDGSFKIFHRFITAFGISDESFVMAVSEQKRVTPSYMYGLITLPILGWTCGTALGAFSGDILPQNLCVALGLAIYSMFVAIIVPPAKKDKGVMYAILISCVMSCCIYYIPFLARHISSGFAVIICALGASFIMAKLKPVPETKEVAENE